MKIKPILLLFIINLFYGCSQMNNSPSLTAIDSLVLAEKYDSAYHEILRMDCNFNNENDKAHYQLLLAQTSYLTYNTLSSDDVIDSAIAYYEKRVNAEKLADAYYYKAAFLYERNDCSQAIVYYKKAEEQANTTGNTKLQYKIAESIVRLNNHTGNYSLQLDYARKALAIATKTNNKNWMAYSTFYLSRAFQNLNNMDSLTVYSKKLIPLLDDIYPEDLPHFLSCIGYMYYCNGQLDLAKKYYKEALSNKEIALTYGNLADVYVEEGNEEEAYRLWQKAILLEDGTTKDIIMFNMLQYDLNHNRHLEDACERLFRIFAIKDSVTNTLKDRTILELQQKYDEEVIHHQNEKTMLRWITATLCLLLLVLVLMGYINYKKYHTRMLISKHQMLISRYSKEIEDLERLYHKAENDINKYKEIIANNNTRIYQLRMLGDDGNRQISELNTQIAELEKTNVTLTDSCELAKRQIDDLNLKIRRIVENASPILNRGKILYDDMLQNKTTSTWRKHDYMCFVEFYKALHLIEYEALEKQYKRLTYHNAFFLILHEMGKDDKTVCHIMGITQEAVRSTRYRLRQNLKNAQSK